MDVNNIDERILWEDIRGEAVDTILGLVECWSLTRYKIRFARHCFHRCKHNLHHHQSANPNNPEYRRKFHPRKKQF